MQLLEAAQDLVSRSKKQNATLTDTLKTALEFYVAKKSTARKMQKRATDSLEKIGRVQFSKEFYYQKHVIVRIITQN